MIRTLRTALCAATFLCVQAIWLAPSQVLAQGCGQGNPNCIAPTPPNGDNSNRIATTQFVQNTIIHGALPLNSGFIYVGNASNAAVGLAMSGSCTMNNTGVITCPASGITAGQPLTKTDDTNVTLTLGGAAATSLLASASITAGWTGQLSALRGGTGVANSFNIAVGGALTTAGVFTQAGAFATTITTTALTNSTLPAGTHTLMGRDTTDTMSNKTFDTAATGNVFKINGTAVTALSGVAATLITAGGSFTTPSQCLQTDASGNGTVVLSGSNCGAGGNTPQTRVFHAPGDFTPGVTSTLTIASPPNDAKILFIYFNGFNQATDTWTLNTSTGLVTFLPIPGIPLNVDTIQMYWSVPATVAGVASIGGVGGAIALSSGLSMVGSALTLTAVQTVGGVSGALTVAGDISMVGSAITGTPITGSTGTVSLDTFLGVVSNVLYTTSDPKKYLATCNGSTDDTSALQNAFNASGIGTIDFSNAGTCKISTTLALSSRKNIIGVSGSSTIKLVQTGGGAAHAGIVFNAGSEGSVIRGITIDYDAGTGVSSGGEAILCNTTGITIDTVEVNGHKSTQVVQNNGIDCGQSDTTIKNSYVHDVSGYGILANNGSRINIFRNRVEKYTVGSGINVQNIALGFAMSKLFVQDNVVDQSDLAGSALVVNIQVRGDATFLHDGPTITGNRTYATQNASASGNGSITCQYCQGAAIVGNYVSGGGIGISVGAGYNNSVTGGAVNGVKFYALELAGDDVTASGVSINGQNVTLDCIAAQGGAYAGIVAASNTCNQFTRHGGAQASSILDTLFIGNSFTYCNCTLDASSWAIFAAGAKASAIGNILVGKNNARKGVFFEGPTSGIIQGNVNKNFSEEGTRVEANAIAVNHLTIGPNQYDNNTVQVAMSSSGGGTFGTDIAIADANGFFSVNLNGSNQTGLGPNAYSKIAFSHVAAGNAQGWFDVVTNHQYTVQLPGIYRFTLQGAVTTSGTNAPVVRLYKNSSGLIQGTYTQNSTAGEIHSQVTYDIPLAIGDIIEGYIYTGDATAVLGSTEETWMTGYRLPAGY